jgi:hypothetical protein
MSGDFRALICGRAVVILAALFADIFSVAPAAELNPFHGRFCHFRRGLPAIAG